MALIVQKFGGTSVGDLDRIEAVADKVLAAREAGDDIVVVLSAMAGETDRLLGYARAISTHGRPNPRELDLLLSTGEQVTIALLCMALEKRGVTARSFTGFQAGIHTDDAHNKARILDIDTHALVEQIGKGRVPVVAGFQGMDAAGNITTLGRGGSDTTAVAIAAALNAAECHIYTDVDGVYTTDPRIVSDARRVDRLSCAEMLEMAAQGSKVLQVRSVEFAQQHRVELRVLSTFEPGPGTLITHHAPNGSTIVTGIACSRDEAAFRVRNLPGVAGDLLRLLTDSRIEIDMLQSGVSRSARELEFSVSRQEYEQAREILAAPLKDTGALVEINSRLAKVTLVGGGISAHPDVCQRVMAALKDAGIAIWRILPSPLRISLLVDEFEMEKAVRTLHHEFRLNEAPVHVKAG